MSESHCREIQPEQLAVIGFGAVHPEHWKSFRLGAVTRLNHLSHLELPEQNTPSTLKIIKVPSPVLGDHLSGQSSKLIDFFNAVNEVFHSM